MSWIRGTISARLYVHMYVCTHVPCQQWDRVCDELDPRDRLSASYRHHTSRCRNWICPKKTKNKKKKKNNNNYYYYYYYHYYYYMHSWSCQLSDVKRSEEEQQEQEPISRCGNWI